MVKNTAIGVGYTQSMQNSTLSQRIFHTRNKAGLKRAQVARALCVSSPSVSAWETEPGSKGSVRPTRPSIEHLEALSLLFGVAFEWLAVGTGPKTHGAGYSPLVDTGQANINNMYIEASASQRQAIVEAVMAITQWNTEIKSS